MSRFYLGLTTGLMALAILVNPGSSAVAEDKAATEAPKVTPAEKSEEKAAASDAEEAPPAEPAVDKNFVAKTECATVCPAVEKAVKRLDCSSKSKAGMDLEAAVPACKKDCSKGEFEFYRANCAATSKSCSAYESCTAEGRKALDAGHPNLPKDLVTD